MIQNHNSCHHISQRFDEERVGGLDGGGGFDDEEEGFMRKRRVE